MQRKFITSLGFLLFLNLLIKPFWLLGIDRSVQNVTGAEVYGDYFALFNFSFLFNILLDLGITNFNNRNIAQNRHLLSKHLSGIIMIRILLAGLYLAISMISAFIIGYDEVQIKMLLVLMLNQILISFILYLRSNLAGLHLFKTDSVISVLDRTVMIAICAWLLWGRGEGAAFEIEWFIWAQTAAYVITVIITLILLTRKTDFLKLNWNPLFAMMILKKSYPFAILILLMTFYNRVDSVMLERMLEDGPEQAGIYAQAFRLLDASNMIAYLFAGLLLPIFSHMLKHKEDIRNMLKLSFTLIALPAITVVLMSWFYSQEIMDLLYEGHVESSVPVFSLLMTGFFAVSTTYIFGTLLTANGNLKQLNRMAAAGMLLNICLNLFLIPHFKATGAAVASLITQFITAGIQVILCMNIFKLRYDWSTLGRLVLFVVTGAISLYFSKLLTNDWIFNLAAGLACCALISFILKLVDLKEMTLILSKREL
jgi:O-antigen/teichoic acid export membrane protein